MKKNEYAKTTANMNKKLIFAVVYSLLMEKFRQKLNIFSQKT